MAPFTWRRMIRRPFRLIAILGISFAFCCFLCYLSSHLDQQQEELINIQTNYDVMCIASDLAGTKTAGLRIGSVVTDSVRNPVYGLTDLIRDVSLTKEFLVQCDLLDFRGTMAYGVTDESCSERLDPAFGSEVRYLSNYTGNFYCDSEAVCLVSQAIYQQLNANELSMKLTDCYSAETHGWAPLDVTLHVVGIYGGDSDDIFIPWAYAEQLMTESPMGVTSDSIRFYMKDNRRIGEMSLLASKKFAVVDYNHDSSLYDCALIVQDGAYRAMLSGVLQNIRKTELLIPVMMILSLGIGCCAAFLGTRSEHVSYALMRVQGVSRGQLFFSCLSEQAVPAVPGALFSGFLFQKLTLVYVFLALFVIGCMAALLPLSLKSPLENLRNKE